jgi:DNA polymerase
MDLYELKKEDINNREQRIERLKKISDCINNCDKCDLCKTRIKTVPGQGNVMSRIFVIGEGPGKNEDEEGLPFVGKAGQLLTELFKESGISRENLFITNIVKCRPPNNRVPEEKEMNSCSSYLMEQISIINPKVILTLGASSSNFVLSSNEKISRIRGNPVSYGDISVLPTFHPSYLLRCLTNTEIRKKIIEDLILCKTLSK